MDLISWLDPQQIFNSILGVAVAGALIWLWTLLSTHVSESLRQQLKEGGEIPRKIGGTYGHRGLCDLRRLLCVQAYRHAPTRTQDRQMPRWVRDEDGQALYLPVRLGGLAFRPCEEHEQYRRTRRSHF